MAGEAGSAGGEAGLGGFGILFPTPARVRRVAGRRGEGEARESARNCSGPVSPFLHNSSFAVEISVTSQFLELECFAFRSCAFIMASF